MREIPELDNFLPNTALRVPYNMYPLIEMVVDEGSFFEIRKHFAPNVIVGFARFDGRAAGIVSNNTLHKMGGLDCDASDKLARFVRFCDLFNPTTSNTITSFRRTPDRGPGQAPESSQ